MGSPFTKSPNLNDTAYERTHVIYEIDNVIAKAIERWRNTEERMDSCIDKLQPKLLITDKMLFPELLELIKKDIITRTIFEITEENVFYIKELLRLVKSNRNNKHIIRHLDNVVGNFSISDKKIFQSHVMGDLSAPGKNNSEIKTEREQSESGLSSIADYYSPQCIVSDFKAFVEQQQNIFELMWEKSIPAEQRIRELEQGIEPEVIETIKDKEEIQNLSFSLIESANEEILVIFSTANEFHRQKSAGYFKIIKKVQETRPWIKIHILTPKDIEMEEYIKSNKEFFSFDVVFTEPLQRVSVLVVDKRYSLTVELKDDTKQQPSTDAIGLASYSNSPPTVLSYISVFETLRKQTELLERLKDHDKIQKEFINIAAHELRNPIQPILGLSNHLMNRRGRDREEKELLDTINRNAKRLQRLTESILDITRIEGKSLKLHKEKANLGNLISDIVKNYKNSIDKSKSIKFEFNGFNDKDIVIEADKNRLGQVITNLIGNSIKFIDRKGDIVISVDKRKRNSAGNKRDAVVFSIRDNGMGIDKEIMPKLFTKFATKSFQGTGLGLYISKSIIEAHGGQIWAENNNDGKGATFYFSLPL